MAKQVFDLRGGKGMSAGQSTEHLRNYKTTDPEMKKYGYYDPTRVNLNFEVGKGGVIKPVNKQYSIVQRFKDNLRNRGITDPNDIKRKKGLEPNRNTVANIILGGSREQMHKLAFGDQKVDITRGADNRHITRQPEIEIWAQDMYNYVAKKFGEENIIAFVVHLDEKNPHIHCTLVPVNEKNKLSFGDLFGHNALECKHVFKDLHDEAAKVNEKYGLERGENINVTGAKHRTSEEYWTWLRDTCNELEGKSQGLDSELKGKQDALDFLDKEYRRTDIKVKGLSKMLENLTTRRNDIVEEIHQLEEDANNGRISVDELQQKAQMLHNELEETEKKIKDKQDKLEKANEQLEMLADKQAEFERQNDELQRSINREKHTLEDMTNKRVIQETQAQGWREVTNEIRDMYNRIDDYRDNLSYNERNVFDKFKSEFMDDSVLGDIARDSEKIIAITTMLYLGAVENAMNFAQSHGGGGGGPGKGWGRKPGEDDDSFRGRCFGMARLMMRPPGRRLQR